VARLLPKVPLSKARLLFYAMCIRANRYRYSYGRQANRTLKDLDLPTLDALPSYVDNADLERFKGRDAPVTVGTTPTLNARDWQPFELSSLFTIKKGKRLTKANMLPGDTPFVSALDWNNGLRQRITESPIRPAGVLTGNYNGNGVAEAFYQSEAFYASDDVNVLYPKFEMDSAIALFVCAIIRQEKYRFNYGRKWNAGRMRGSVIRLPVTKEGKPDWNFMRHYIATLPFSAVAVSKGEAAKGFAPQG
jgi:hypothetical protein